MSLYVYLVILVMLFVIILCYNVFSPVFLNMDSDITTMINESNSSLKDDALASIAVIRNTWLYAVIFFLFCLLLWGIVATQKQEPHYY